MKSARPFYHEFAWAYDLLQTERIPPRVDFIQAILTRNGIATGSRVLDAGCGTGRYAAEFAKRGFRVWGVDSSPELIAVARSRDIGGESAVEFVIADLLAVSFQKPFDVVLCRGVLNDFVVDANRRSIFQQFVTWLRPGGVLIFDVREWTRTVARYSQNPLHHRTVELPDGVLRFQSETLLDQESGRMLIRERFEGDKECERTSTENEFIMRPWTAEELASCLHANSLQELATDLTYGETDQAWSDRLVITARKPAAL
ncbi:MAG: class I SAM-dependent methyltransferase [Bryobacteraceae bacterium]